MKKLARNVIVLAVAGNALAACAPTLAPQETPYAPTINPADFVEVIDSPYMPLAPGTSFVYDGATEKGNEHNEVSVTSETNVILGVTCVVVQDTVMVDGALEEQTFDWYAQEKDGDVWYYGEDSKEYENGEVVSTHGSWEAGVDGALPGIVTMAAPALGEVYRQGYDKGAAEDWAEVLSLSESVTAPTGSYAEVLLTSE